MAVATVRVRIITDQNNVGNLNPFRYRGYYYDTESQLYYLMSRYYDPVTHRFINADGYFQSGSAILDANMNAYCGNNPVNFVDSAGKSRESLLKKATDIQIEIASGKPTKYTMSDVLYYLKQAEKSDFQKAWEPVEAFVYSINLELGIGGGLGDKTNILGLNAELLCKADPINLRMNPREIDIGYSFYTGMGIGYEPWDLGIGYEEYTSYITGKTTINGSPEAKISLINQSVYAGPGFTVNGYWDMNYVSNRLEQIW